MKKVLLLLLLSVQISVCIAQNSIIGKWKPIKIDIPNFGELPIDAIKLNEILYKKIQDEKGETAINAKDSADVEELLNSVISQFSTMTMEFKTNKKYEGIVDNKQVLGTYIYDVKKKILTSRPQNKPAKTAVVSFNNGILKLENKKEKVSIYLEKII